MLRDRVSIGNSIEIYKIDFIFKKREKSKTFGRKSILNRPYVPHKHSRALLDQSWRPLSIVILTSMLPPLDFQQLVTVTPASSLSNAHLLVRGCSFLGGGGYNETTVV